MAPKPGTYVKNAIATLGYQDTPHGYWAHSLLFFLTDQYPSSIMLAIFKILNKKTYENALIAKQKDDWQTNYESEYFLQGYDVIQKCKT